MGRNKLKLDFVHFLFVSLPFAVCCHSDEDPHYASINHDTASNYSRPSRVKHYPRDSDSEISGLTGRSDYLYGEW